MASRDTGASAGLGTREERMEARTCAIRIRSDMACLVSVKSSPKPELCAIKRKLSVVVDCIVDQVELSFL